MGCGAADDIGPVTNVGGAGLGARPRMRNACVWLMTVAALAALPCVTALVAPAASAAAIAGCSAGGCAADNAWVSTVLVKLLHCC